MTTNDGYSVKEHGTWREVVTHPGWAWTCDTCGWVGLECSSEGFAHQEAAEHVRKTHGEES